LISNIFNYLKMENYLNEIYENIAIIGLETYSNFKFTYPRFTI